MGQAISEVLPFAIGVAISPLPIIAVILVLFSARAKVNGPAFLAGWLVGVAAVSIVAYVVADAGDASTPRAAPRTASTGSSSGWACSCRAGGEELAGRPRGDRTAAAAQVDGLDRLADAGEGRRPRPGPQRRQPEEPRALAGRRCRAGAAGRVGGRGRGRADRLHPPGERRHRRAGDLLPGRRRARRRASSTAGSPGSRPTTARSWPCCSSSSASCSSARACAASPPEPDRNRPARASGGQPGVGRRSRAPAGSSRLLVTRRAPAASVSRAPSGGHGVGHAGRLVTRAAAGRPGRSRRSDRRRAGRRPRGSTPRPPPPADRQGRPCPWPPSPGRPS